MSTHNIVFYEDLTKIIFELSSNIIKYAPYFFCSCILPFSEANSERSSEVMGKLTRVVILRLYLSWLKRFKSDWR